MKTSKSNRSKTHVILCCSGGIDSTALIHYYLDNGYQVQGIHFDYGQPALQAEINALKTVKKYFDIRVEFAVLRPKLRHSPQGVVYGRNALFVLGSVSHIQHQQALVSLGIHGNSIYYDCSEIFVQQIQGILDGYFDGVVKLDIPFLTFSKRDIVEYCENHKIPLNLTYSCDTGSTEPCGKCLSCKERERALYGSAK